MKHAVADDARVYISPVVTDLGSLAELTQGDLTGSVDDGLGGSSGDAGSGFN